MALRGPSIQGHDKATAVRLAQWAAASPGHTRDLVTILRTGTPREKSTAAWALGLLGGSHPELLPPCVPELLATLAGTDLESVQRNILRAFQFCAIPEEEQGALTDLTFRWAQEPERAIAVRAFAITVAFRMVLAHPELAPELRSVLELVMRRSPPPAIRSRANKALRHLRPDHLRKEAL